VAVVIDTIIQGDCLEAMAGMESESVDMILCDLPYGTTQCSWDTIIPFEPLWAAYKRIIKPNGAIVLTASQPFTTKLIASNMEMFKYCWVWNKRKGGNIFNLNHGPYKIHEDICIFSIGVHSYYPMWTFQHERKSRIYSAGEALGIRTYGDTRTYNKKNPQSIIEFSNADQTAKLHPTQKPVALFGYLIGTYTNEGEVVLDNCIGSGTTAIACIRSDRHYIGIELEQKYVDIANERIRIEQSQLKFDFSIAAG
jgi:site-specific DNA-methyltransferase (adenine-specific)